ANPLTQVFFYPVLPGSFCFWPSSGHVSKRKSMLISYDFVMFYDVFSQNGQRPRLIRNTLANHQLAFDSAHSSILRFTALSRAFLFAICSRDGRPPLFVLRFLHSWFPRLNAIATETTGLHLGSYFAAPS